jgi:hypothetical protein
VAKLLTVNVSDLAVSYELVPKAALNPKEALRSSPKLVASYSNNVLHLLTPAGKVIPALTVEQNNLQLQNRVKGGVLVRVVGALALLLLLGALALIPLRLAWRYHRRNGKCVEDRRS